MKHSLYAVLFLLITTGSAFAQTFGNGLKSEQPAVPAQAQQQQPAAKSDALVDKALQKKEEEPLFTDAIPNILSSSKRTEKKYDNSRGKVIRFKIVDGDVVFQEDKDRMILIYYDDYKVSKGMDKIVRCSMRMYVLNDLETKISNIGFKLIWPGISTSLQMQQVNPGVSSYTDIMLLGDGCFTMDKTPTVEVNRCRVKGLTEEQCAAKVKWFSRNRY